MTESPQTNPFEGGGQCIRSGFQIPFLRKGQVVFGKHLRTAIMALNSFLKLEVKRADAQADSDGTFVRGASVAISNGKVIITLTDPPMDSGDDSGGGTANVVPMQIQSGPSGTNDYFSAKMGSFSGGIFTASGSAINVALPWELRNAQKPTGYTIFQPYGVGDIICALSTSAGMNGVTVAGAELIWMDLGLGRSWVGIQMVYRDTYDSSVFYSVGNVVRVQSGASQGIWICVLNNPGPSNPPTYPEPATTGGTNYWEMFAFGIVSTSVCAGGAKTVDINATPAY